MKADLIIKNVNIFNVYFKKFIPGDVAVLKGRFLHIGEINGEELTAKEVIDGEGQYMIPGLIDIHMHIESSMTTPFQFSQAVTPHGVTTVVADPHEIANVFGIEGIKAFLGDDINTDLDIFYGIPSSVPSTSPRLETTGGIIDEEAVIELLNLDKILCLGEVMNFKELIQDEASLINRIIKIAKDKNSGTPIEGHCPKIEGLDLSRYLYAGVDADHTHQTVKSLEEKIRNGMFMEIQEKSMTLENMSYLIENELYEHFCLVTDDTMADRLTVGHLNRLVKKAMDFGMKPEMAIYTSTFTPARRMGLKDRGAIAPGKVADFVLLRDLREFSISRVYKGGRLVFDGKVEYKVNKSMFPPHFYQSIKLDKLSPEDFDIKAPGDLKEIKCRVMEVCNNATFTEEGSLTVNIRDNKLCWQEEDCCLIAVFNRYGKAESKAFGLVRGTIMKEGAVATSWAHDHHNVMVMGRNIEDILCAVNWVIEKQGGYCAVKDGKILGALELPVGGILSEERIDILGEKLKSVREALKTLGYDHHNEIMSFSTLSLPVSPSLKITDKGLIRVKTQEIVSLYHECHRDVSHNIVQREMSLF